MKYHASYLEDLRRVGKSVRRWKNLKGKTVLITGASGLIGSAIVDVLAQLNMDERAGITILAAGRTLHMLFVLASLMLNVKAILRIESE